MDVQAHFKSLTAELEALRDRVRNFSVATPHWPTDGEWKESVLRAVLRGYLPAHIEPVRGFVVTPQRGSGQIDVLLYDNRKPVLFRNGDLVFATPDAVAGIVEVKSHIANRTALRNALTSLADDAEMIRCSRAPSCPDLFVGLFSYVTGVAQWAGVLDDLQETARGDARRIVSHVCLGCSHFTRFWSRSPEGQHVRRYDSWHAYELPNQSAGYFINNLVASVAGESVADNHALWFPRPGKELRRLGTRHFALARRGHPARTRRRALRGLR
jgi:hypothetical protein